jgi:hypothetical protein
MSIQLVTTFSTRITKRASFNVSFEKRFELDTVVYHGFGNLNVVHLDEHTEKYNSDFTFQFTKSKDFDEPFQMKISTHVKEFEDVLDHIADIVLDGIKTCELTYPTPEFSLQ